MKPAQRRPRAERVTAEFLADVDEAAGLVRRLKTEGPVLIHRAAIAVWDGHGPGRSADDVSVSSSGIRDLSAVVARREDLAESGIDPDPVATGVSIALARTRAAVLELRRAVEGLASATRVPASEGNDEPPRCVNCQRWDVVSAAHKAGRCVACYGYRRRHDGRDAPEDLVTARAEVSGRRHRVRAA